MPKFIVYATLTTQLEKEIEAESLEQAEKIADKDLITDDFDVINQDFKLEAVTRKERK
jgi:hypothetical protein